MKPHADLIELCRVRIITTLCHVRAELAERELGLGPRQTCLYVAGQTKYWTHDWRAVVRDNVFPIGPRGEALMRVHDWRGFLDAAERERLVPLAVFMAAHGDNCRHPFLNQAWSATTWSSYEHALRRWRRTARSAA